MARTKRVKNKNFNKITVGNSDRVTRNRKRKADDVVVDDAEDDELIEQADRETVMAETRERIVVNQSHVSNVVQSQVDESISQSSVFIFENA